MKSKLLALSLCIFLAACADDIKETGITKAQAIVVAKRACPEYPDQFNFVDKAEWIPEKGFWAVLLDDRSGDHGRVYKINRNGEIVGTRDIDVEHPPGYYDGPYYGGPYYGPPVVVGVYGRGPYHRRWWY